MKQYSFAKSQGRNLSDNWEGCLFIYSCYAQQISFEINLNSKEIRRAGHEYMNKHPPPPPRISVLVTSLLRMYIVYKPWLR